MAYTTNPKLPRLRMQAVLMVRRGASTHRAARYFGYNQSTVARWVKRADVGLLKGSENLPTRSSKPKSHPKQLSKEVVATIVAERLKHGRCSEVIYADLKERGVAVSLSSVKRTLARQELLKTKKYRRQRLVVPRPLPSAPGVLVQADTIHYLDWQTHERFYVYTLIDVHSRWAYAELHQKLRSATALDFVLRAQAKAGFSFQVLQTDNGPEFAVWFRTMLSSKGVILRHSRVRKPNDNAHVERFNRTLQEECIGKYATWEIAKAKDLPSYLNYYNTERRHMGLHMKRPAELLLN
jgi:transposase InsO family protein